MAALRTAFFKQLAMGGGLSVLAAVIATEGLMSWATSSSVGFRARKDALRYFDGYWAGGAMVGVFVGLVIVHVLWHWRRVDPEGCLLRW